LSKQDPQTNLTDVYGFVTAGNTLTVVVNCRPFSEPGDGIMYDRFADDALYSINIANPATGALLMTYNFQFSPVSSAAGSYKNTATAFSYGRGTGLSAGAITTIGGPTQNYVQTYTVTAVNQTTSSSTSLGTFTVPPPNTGTEITPTYNGKTAPANAGAAAQNATAFAVSGATTPAGLDSLTAQAIGTAQTGEMVFAGSREDSFFADAPGIFDLLNARIIANSSSGTSLGQAGGGVDGFKGYNVLTFAIQIPLGNLPTPIAYSTPFLNFPNGGTAHGLGIYASVSRQRITLRSATGDNQNSGPWIQINRLGNPLFNEVLVAIQDKDNYNRDVPTNDSTKYAKYASSPEVAVLLNAVFGTNFVTTGRADLVAVYIPDVLRVDLTTAAVPQVGQAMGASRLSGLGGDTIGTGAGDTAGTIWSGWPNGRRLGDDVVDIALTATASGPTFGSGGPPVVVLGDNVNMNDQTYNFVFPFAATPNAGTRNSKDAIGTTPSNN